MMRGAPRRGRLAAFVAAAIGAIVFGSITGCTELSSTGAPTTTVDARVVQVHLESCVAALNSGDEAKLAALLNNPAQPHDARHRIELLGGRQWRIAWLTQREEFPGVVAVHLRLAQASGVIVELREVLQFEGGVVTLGPLAAGTFMTTGPS